MFSIISNHFLTNDFGRFYRIYSLLNSFPLICALDLLAYMHQRYIYIYEETMKAEFLKLTVYSCKMPHLYSLLGYYEIRFFE